MDDLLLLLHSWLRWLVLIFGVAAAVRGSDAAGKWFVITLDVQVLIGLVLYFFVSPYTLAAWGNMAEAMRDSLTRFLAVEHLFGMIVATAFAHVGRARQRRQKPARVFYGLALLAMLATIPWPFMPVSRPFFRVP